VEDDPNDPGDLTAGAELAGGYTIEHVAMQGRTRLIYAARAADGALVAVHVLDAGLVDGLGEWFTQGAEARAELQHPVLLRTLAVGRLDDGRPFEVTELLEGTSMREALDASPEGLDPLAVVHVVNEVAGALDMLHGRSPLVTHRTLCPEHMMVLRDTHEVRLLGLFYADRPQFESVRPGYRSPEELAGVLALGARADVFSLATVAYELLTGRHAWPQAPELALDAMRVGVRDRVSVLRPTLPGALDAVFEQAWSLSPDARHATAGRFAKAFRAAIDPLDVAASLAANVFDDRPTAEVSVAIVRARNNTLLNAGAVAQAIVPRAVVGVVKAAEEPDREERASRPPPPRMLRAPVPPGTRPVRAPDTDSPAKIALPRPADVLPPPVEAPVEQPSEETPVSTAAPVTGPTTPSDLGRFLAPITEVTQESVLPRPAADATSEARAAVAASDPPDEPTPLAVAAAPSPAPSPAPRPAIAEAPAPAALAPAPTEAPLPPVVASAPASVAPPVFHSPLDAPPLQAPINEREARLFLDEPTTVIHTLPAPSTAWTRSPVVLAGLFIAHAVLIVGIAHAIAYAMVQRQSPVTQFVAAPPAVCAPCAACPSAVPLPDVVSQPLAPTGQRVARPASPRTAPVGQQIIRSVPDFGRPR
jgi:hypothetical protein